MISSFKLIINLHVTLKADNFCFQCFFISFIMKKTTLYISICLLLSACVGGKTMNQGEIATIDVETTFQNPQELSLTDFGEKLTYIPLETLDKSLINLGSNSKLIVTDEYIFVGEIGRPLLCFDRSNGKFLRNIGNIGQGPGEYTGSTDAQVDAEAKRIYIRSAASSYHCYDFNGKFLQTLNLPEENFFMGSHYFTNNKAYAYCNMTSNTTTSRAYAYQLPEGTRIDSLALNETSDRKQKIVMPIQGTEIFGGRFFMVEYEDGTWTSGNRQNSTYQSINGKLYHKDLFCDTLFRMKGLYREEPVATFHLGSLGGYERYETAGNMEGKYILPRVLYNGEQIYFTLYTGLYDVQGTFRKAKSGGIRPSCGIYNLRTGEVKIQKDNIRFKHSDEAMPKTCIYTLSTDGSWVAVYKADKLVEARENIPEEQQPEWMKNLKEDDNPVLLIIK